MILAIYTARSDGDYDFHSCVNYDDAATEVLAKRVTTLVLEALLDAKETPKIIPLADLSYLVDVWSEEVCATGLETEKGG